MRTLVVLFLLVTTSAYAKCEEDIIKWQELAALYCYESQSRGGPCALLNGGYSYTKCDGCKKGDKNYQFEGYTYNTVGARTGESYSCYPVFCSTEEIFLRKERD